MVAFPSLEQDNTLDDSGGTGAGTSRRRKKSLSFVTDDQRAFIEQEQTRGTELVEEVRISTDDAAVVFNQVVARFDAPAYVRRAQRVQQNLDDLIARCRKQRTEWLMMTRLHIGTLRALAGDWVSLQKYVSEDGLRELERLHDELQPQLRLPVERDDSPRVLRAALAEVRASIARFNRRWEEFLRGIDLGPVNAEREAYNRYYVLEKECALRNAVVARHGFQPLPVLTTVDLQTILPPLPDVA
jgi:hypothetical protein